MKTKYNLPNIENTEDVSLKKIIKVAKKEIKEWTKFLLQCEKDIAQLKENSKHAI